MGRVDLHNHILYEIDDGATDAAESLALARALVQAGYTDVATTPHAKPELDPAKDLVEQRRGELQALLDRESIPLRLHQGCENHLTPQFLARLTTDPRPLGAGKYVLVELPFQTPVLGLRDILFKIQLAGLRPIFAHPERCANFVGRLEAARELFDAGAHFQIELGSMAGIYGGPAKKLVAAMLDEGMVALTSTDAHHLKSANEILTAGSKALAKTVGPTRFALLTEENPGRILRGEQIISA